MNARMYRVSLAPGYILHHRPFRDTSRILEVLTRDHGRLTLFARGARGPKSRLAALLRPFEPLLLSWAGRGEAARLVGAEPAAGSSPAGAAAQRALPAQCVLPAFYLTELLLKLTVRHDPQPQLYEHYDDALRSWKQGAPLERVLRLFEKRLLDTLGYGLDLEAIDGGLRYRFSAGEGFRQVADGDAAGAPIPGRALLSLDAESLDDAVDLEHARLVLRAALAQCLEGRVLATRAVARSIQQKRRA